MNSPEASGWLVVLQWLAHVDRATLLFVLGGAAMFGVRLPPTSTKPWIEVHGLLHSLWVGAQGIGRVGDTLGRIEGKLDGLIRRFDRRFPEVADSIPPSRPGSISDIEPRR